MVDSEKPLSERRFDLTGYEVTFLHIDYRFGFDCLAGSKRNGSLEIVICKEFSVIRSGIVGACNPETGSGLADALIILHKPLASLTVYRTGLLIVRFVNEMRLEVEPTGCYEAWESRGTGDLSEISFLADAGVPLWI